MQVADDSGRFLDASVGITLVGADVASITFESQGGGRNTDYIGAHNLVVSRLAAASATIVDALVVSSDSKHLKEVDRRFFIPGRPYPYLLSPQIDSVEVARMLRRGAAEVARRKGATGPGNRAKRIELRFSIPDLDSRPALWLDEHLVAPGGAMDAEAVLVASKPSSRVHTSYMQDSAARRAVELRAMAVATEVLGKTWNSIADVSATESFDLLCRSGATELRVEVKGTTSGGATVVLTRNEVRHAKENYPHVALYVVSRIDLRLRNGVPIATGGVLTQYSPWKVDDFELVPLSFQYFLSAGNS